MSNPAINDTIRLTQHELTQLLADLNRGGHKPSSKRKTKRWAMPQGKAICTLVDPSKREQHHIVVVRNLSSGGAAFLLGSFVYTGTRCTLLLRGSGGKGRAVSGRVARCQHIRGHLHDIGVKFDEAVSPKEFIDFGDQNAFSIESVDVASLKGTLLVVEDNRADQRLIAHHFKGSGLELQFAQDGASGLQCLGDVPDVVFTDYQLPDMTGIDLINKAREAGYGGPILLISAEQSPHLRVAALKAGACEVLSKPFTPSLLHQAAAEYLIVKCTASAMPAKLVSTAAEADASGEMVLDYVADLQNSADKLDELFKKDLMSEARTLILQIKGNAATYGFKALSQAASDATKNLDATMSLQESAQEVHKVIAACRRVRPRDAT